MPAKSKPQQRLFGMVHAFKTGALSLKNLPAGLADKVKKVSKSISDKAAVDFARTKGLTESLSFTQFLIIQEELADTFTEQEAIQVLEAWDHEVEINPKKKGMFKDKSVEELKSELAALKSSGPHKEGSSEFTREKELMFAIRAKNGWKAA